MNAAYRQLYLFQQLLTGQIINKQVQATHFNVHPRVIQRDLSQIRQFIADQQLFYELTYQRKLGGYRLLIQQDTLSKQAILVVTKILLASRSLNQTELNQTIDSLLRLVKSDEQAQLATLIKNEQFHYLPVHHEKSLLQIIWQFSQFILKKQAVTIQYQRQHGEIVKRTILPEAVIFSEYYFYIISYNPVYDNHLFYRADRIQTYQLTSEKIERPYAQRFEDGQLRQYITYMQPGQKITITFEYWGIVEAALDRFPTAIIKERYPQKGSVLIEATVFDQGAQMWLLSQGSLVKVVSPPSFKTAMRICLEKALSQY